MGWSIHFGDKVWREADITLGQAARLQELTNERWPVSPLTSASHLLATIAVFLSDGTTSAPSLNEAIAVLQAMNAIEVFGMVRVDDDPSGPADIASEQ
jgi:hypothetical protein